MTDIRVRSVGDGTLRHPSGSVVDGKKVGGRWMSAPPRQAPDALDNIWLTDDQYNKIHVPSAPPMPRSAAQVFAFWKTVKLSKTFIKNIQNADEARCLRTAKERRDAEIEVRYAAAAKRPHMPAAKRRHDEAIQDAEAALNAIGERREHIEIGMLQDVIRAGHAYFQAFDLPEDERELLLNTTWVCGNNDLFTIRDLYYIYRLDEIRGAFFEEEKFRAPE